MGWGGEVQKSARDRCVANRAHAMPLSCLSRRARAAHARGCRTRRVACACGHEGRRRNTAERQGSEARLRGIYAEGGHGEASAAPSLLRTTAAGALGSVHAREAQGAVKRAHALGTGAGRQARRPGRTRSACVLGHVACRPQRSRDRAIARRLATAPGRRCAENPPWKPSSFKRDNNDKKACRQG